MAKHLDIDCQDLQQVVETIFSQPPAAEKTIQLVADCEVDTVLPILIDFLFLGIQFKYPEYDLDSLPQEARVELQGYIHSIGFHVLLDDEILAARGNPRLLPNVIRVGTHRVGFLEL